MSRGAVQIEICGGIASGKTTLAQGLRCGKVLVLLEKFRENPFWHSFYKSPSQCAFETEVTFLLQHYHCIKTAFADGQLIVSDFALLQDLAYADVNLSGGRYDAFSAVHEQVLRELPPAGLLVHLQCSAKEELRRIRARGRTEEKSITVDYLDKLNRAIARRVEKSRDGIRVLTIDSHANDFAHDTATQKRIVGQVLDALPT